MSYSDGMYRQSQDLSKIFIGNNDTVQFRYTNGTGDDVDLAAGTVFGHIASTNKVTPCISTATDGSQIPRFVLAGDYSVADGDTKTLSLVYCGKVDEDMLIFQESGSPLEEETLDGTVVYWYTNVKCGTMRTALMMNGVVPVSVNEMTIADNS